MGGGEFVQPRGVGVEELGHLVDEGAGAARAGAVHALLGGGVEVGDLGVLAAELDDDVGLGVLGLDGAGLGDDLLDEGQAHEGGQTQARTAGDGAAHGCVREALGGLREEAGDLAAHVGIVTAVFGEHGLGQRGTGGGGVTTGGTGWVRQERRLRRDGRGHSAWIRQEHELDRGGPDVEAQGHRLGTGWGGHGAGLSWGGHGARVNQGRAGGADGIAGRTHRSSSLTAHGRHCMWPDRIDSILRSSTVLKCHSLWALSPTYFPLISERYDQRPHFRAATFLDSVE